MQNTFLKAVQSNCGTAPLFVHCNLWQCIEDGGKSMYCIIENFCSQIFMDTTWGWCYVGVYMCLWKCEINKKYPCSCSILSVIDSSCMLLCVARKCHIIPAHCGWGKDVAIMNINTADENKCWKSILGDPMLTPIWNMLSLVPLVLAFNSGPLGCTDHLNLGC
jgi:hypothetical protein